jgi:dTDP-4-amino-4,6-dideoxygalactose transaminase
MTSYELINICLELSAMLFDISPGDEVIVPSYTFVSTASAFLRNNCKIIFSEIDPETLMMDINDVKMKISARTKAIVPIHYGGYSANIIELKNLCDENNIILIEDNAQGLGSKINDKYLGTFGHASSVSFHETKNIHCGLGGAIFINENDSALIDRAEDIWERGTDRQKLFKGLVDKYGWVDLGSSFYPSELQAAFLYAQLESIDKNIEDRSKLSNIYFEKLGELENQNYLKLQKNTLTTSFNNHAVIIILKNEDEADALRIHLKENGIGAFIGYVPLHSSKYGQKIGWKPEDLEITEKISKTILRLPLHNNLTEKDILYICLKIKNFFN